MADACPRYFSGGYYGGYGYSHGYYGGPYRHGVYYRGGYGQRRLSWQLPRRRYHGGHWRR